MAGKAGKGGGSKKIGRNKVKCKLYATQGRLEKNKARKAKKQIKQESKNAGIKDLNIDPSTGFIPG